MARRNHLGYQLESAGGNERACPLTDRFALEVYQAFMTGYVRRINEATLKVTIGGVRIGSARYSRLAQINLKSRIITFSRYAVENVPERGRRYLVIHELAHVKEPSHNRRFWELVARFEPNYRQVGKALELAFKRNVREEQLAQQPMKLTNPLSGRLEEPKLLLSPRMALSGERVAGAAVLVSQIEEAGEAGSEDYFCMEEEFSEEIEARAGIIHGGSEIYLPVATSS